jgi:hypothetical protein
MTRNEFLEDILKACEFYYWNVLGVYKYYQIVSITNYFVCISVIHYCEKESYAEVLEFQNDEELIDNMIEVL